MSKKVSGGQPQYYKGIVGLSQSNGRFYITHSKPRKWLGKDLDSALIKLREWEAKQEKRVVQGKDWSNHPNDVLREPYDRDGITVIPVPKPVNIPEDVFWSMFREKMRESPTRCAEASGYPLDRLHDFPSPEDSPKLQSLINEYCDKAPTQDEWKYKCRIFWDEFTKAVKVKTISQLTQKLIVHYGDEINSKGMSPTYVKHRFGAVKRVFNFARQRGIAPDEMRRVIDWCAVLILPKANGHDPHPISIKDYHGLLNCKKTSDQWKAMLLVAMNACMYGIEISRLEWDEIDLKKRTLTTKRDKTGVVRVATLWNRTVAAFKKLPMKTDYVFLAYNGAPYNADGLRTSFRSLREKANVKASVKFSDIRDGAYTAAIEGGADLLHAKLLAGHETGISDHYVRRNPKMVSDACQAIETHYFGGKKETP